MQGGFKRMKLVLFVGLLLITLGIVCVFCDRAGAEDRFGIDPADLVASERVLVVLVHGENAAKMAEDGYTSRLDTERGILFLADFTKSGDAFEVIGPFEMKFVKGKSAARIFKDQGERGNLFVDFDNKVVLVLKLDLEV